MVDTANQNWVRDNLTDPNRPKTTGLTAWWNSDELPTQKAVLADTLSQNDPNATFEFLRDDANLSAAQVEALEALQAADPNFSTNLHQALFKNDNIVNALLDNDSALSGMLSVPTQVLEAPYVAQAVTSTLAQAATNPDFDIAGAEAGIITSAQNNLFSNLRGMPPQDRLATLTQAADIRLDVDPNSVSTASQDIIRYLNGASVDVDGTAVTIDPDFRDAIVDRLSTDRTAFDAAMNGTGASTFSVDDLAKITPSQQAALINVLNDTSTPLDLSDIQGQVAGQIVQVNADAFEAAFSGLSGNALFEAFRDSPLSGTDKSFFDRFEITDAEKADITARGGSVQDAVNEAAGLKDAFTNAIGNNPSFGGMVSTMLQEDPAMIDKLMKDPANDINFGFGVNALSYIANNPDLDISSLKDSLPNIDTSNMSPQQMIQAFKDADLSQLGRHAFGFGQAMYNDNKDQVGDLWAMGVDAYRSFFDEIKDSIAESTMDQGTKEMLMGLVTMLEEMFPMMLEGLGNIANLGLGLGQEIGRVASNSDGTPYFPQHFQNASYGGGVYNGAPRIPTLQSQQMSLGVMQDAANLAGVHPDLIRAVWENESLSSTHSTMISPTGATGPMQFTQRAWREEMADTGNISRMPQELQDVINGAKASGGAAVLNLRNHPEISIYMGAFHLERKAERIGVDPMQRSDFAETYMAYNVGEGNARQVMRGTLPRNSATGHNPKFFGGAGSAAEVLSRYENAMTSGMARAPELDSGTQMADAGTADPNLQRVSASVVTTTTTLLQDASAVAEGSTADALIRNASLIGDDSTPLVNASFTASVDPTAATEDEQTTVRPSVAKTLAPTATI